MSKIGAPTAEPLASEQRADDDAAAGGGGHSNTGLYPPQRSGRSTRMIGEVVVDLGFADRRTVDEAVENARTQGRPTGTVLVEQGVLRHDQLARVVAERFGLDYVDLAVYDLDMGAVNLLSHEASKRYQAVPIGFTDDGTLLLAMADPTNVLTIDDVAMMTGRRVRPVAASVEDLNLLLARLTSMEDSIEDIVDEQVEGDEEEDTVLDEADSDAPIIKLVHSIVAQAIQQGASDIHVNPEEGDTRVLFRVDGVLAPAATVKRKMAMGVVSRIKIMADLDISERRMPQDGRFGLTVDGRRVDIRVVTLPLVYGEAVVLRILDKGAVVQGLESLGHAARRACALHGGDQEAERRRARHRPDRLGQVDDAVRRAQRAQRRRTQHPDDRGPRRAADRRDQADADRAEGRRHVRRRAALDAARRPRRDHGRRDPRPRDRAHRRRGGADRAPRALARCTRATRRARSGA